MAIPRLKSRADLAASLTSCCFLNTLWAQITQWIYRKRKKLIWRPLCMECMHAVSCCMFIQGSACLSIQTKLESWPIKCCVCIYWVDLKSNGQKNQSIFRFFSYCGLRLFHGCPKLLPWCSVKRISTVKCGKMLPPLVNKWPFFAPSIVLFNGAFFPQSVCHTKDAPFLLIYCPISENGAVIWCEWRNIYPNLCIQWFSWNMSDISLCLHVHVIKLKNNMVLGVVCFVNFWWSVNSILLQNEDI